MLFATFSNRKRIFDCITFEVSTFVGYRQYTWLYHASGAWQHISVSITSSEHFWRKHDRASLEERIGSSRHRFQMSGLLLKVVRDLRKGWYLTCALYNIKYALELILLWLYFNDIMTWKHYQRYWPFLSGENTFVCESRLFSFQTLMQLMSLQTFIWVFRLNRVTIPAP